MGLIKYGLFFGTIYILFFVIFGSFSGSLGGGLSPEISLFSGVIAIFSTMLFAFKKNDRDFTASEKKRILFISMVIVSAIKGFFVISIDGFTFLSFLLYFFSVVVNFIIFILIVNFSWKVLYPNNS